MSEFKRKQPVKDLVVDATAARLARTLPTQACEPRLHPPAHCDAWIKFQIRNDAMKGCGGKQCSRMFQVKTRQRLANFCLSKSFLDSAMLKHAEAIPRIFKQQYEQRRLLVACCPVLWKESWFLTSLRWVQFSAARYVQPFSSIKELTSQRNW